MATYGIRSKSVLDRALRDLESEGLLTLRQGSGIYVRKRRVVTRDLVAGLRLEHQRAMTGTIAGGLFEAMTGTEADDLSVTTEYARIGAPDRVARALGVAPGTPVLERTFWYVIGGEPHQVARSYLPVETADRAGLISPASERPGVGTMAQLHQAGITVGLVKSVIETRMPSTEEASRLAIHPGTPVYEHWRVMYRQDAPAVPVEVSTAIVPGDRIAYVVEVNLGGIT
jgi:GntR family transcriptional regulator